MAGSSRPGLLELENRWLLATLIVSDPSGFGPNTLTAEIQIANSNDQPKTIEFDAQEFHTPQTIGILSTLELSDTNGLQEIKDTVAPVTIYGDNALRDFQVDSHVIAMFSGLNITGGNSSYANDGYGGAGVLNFGNVTLNNCNIHDDTTGNEVGSSIYGGGIENLGGLVYLNNSNLSADGTFSYGGGLYNSGTARISNCTLSGDEAQNGGALYNTGTGTANLQGCTISGNGSGNSGGAVYNGGGNMTLTVCTINDNSCGSIYYGGGLYNDGGSMVIEYSTISSNSSGEYGGGLYNDGFAGFFGCTFNNNQGGEDGGGIYNDSTLDLAACTFSGNRAQSGYYGGGVYNDDTANIVCSTFSTNTAAYGGGIYNYHTATLSARRHDRRRQQLTA